MCAAVCPRVYRGGRAWVEDEPRLLPVPAATNGGRSETRALIEDLRAGEESAYAALFHEHFQRLTDYAMSFVRSRDEAREVVQEVFVSLYVDRERLQLEGQVLLYLFRAVRNRALNVVRDDRYRTQWARAAAGGRGPAISWNDGESAVLRGEIADRVRQLIDELPPKCKDAFLLVRVYGKTYEEAAAILGVYRSTIQSNLIRATKILGRQLGELGLIDGAVRPGAAKRSHGGGHAR
jgi:RNA polymerase sigma-70 factor, ECF subfamily